MGAFCASALSPIESTARWREGRGGQRSMHPSRHTQTQRHRDRHRHTGTDRDRDRDTTAGAKGAATDGDLVAVFLVHGDAAVTTAADFLCELHVVHLVHVQHEDHIQRLHRILSRLHRMACWAGHGVSVEASGAAAATGRKRKRKRKMKKVDTKGAGGGRKGSWCKRCSSWGWLTTLCCGDSCTSVQSAYL